MHNSKSGAKTVTNKPFTVLTALAVCALLAVPVQGAKDGTSGSGTPAGSPASSTTIEQINWDVISQGATYGSNSQYQLIGTAGQTAIGVGVAPSFTLGQGFWQDFGSQGCCVGITGNVDDDPDEVIDIGDLTAMIRYLYILPNPEPPCPEEADTDGDADGVLDIGDIAALIAHLYIPPYPMPAPCQ